jgi:hypothetical protein
MTFGLRNNPQAATLRIAMIRYLRPQIYLCVPKYFQERRDATPPIFYGASAPIDLNVRTISRELILGAGRSEPTKQKFTRSHEAAPFFSVSLAAGTLI